MAKSYEEKVVPAKTAISSISRGKRVFIGSYCGEPQYLVSELIRHTDNFSDVEVVRFLNLEGSLMGLVADETQGRCYHVRSIYQGSGMIAGLTASRRFLTPMNLYTVPSLFLKRHIPIHYALIQTAPPDEFGWLNLGISVDITLAAAQAADVVIVQINPKMPVVPGYGMIHVDDVDFIVEQEEEILSVYPTPPIHSTDRISKLLSSLIEDGSTLHISPGFSQELIFSALADKKDLGIHSLMILDVMKDLADKGVITNRKKGFNEGKMLASGAIGSEDLYHYLNRNPAIEFRPCDYISNPVMIARHNKMTSINRVTSVDLKGQVAADGSAQNHFADVAGLVDFSRGASMAPGGKSIVILPSLTESTLTSNIVLEQAAGTVAIPAADVTYVITEYGAVNLFGKNVQERAMAMISIAHPNFREKLFEQARQAGLIGQERKLYESQFGTYPAWLEEVLTIAGQKVTLRPVKTVDDRLIQEHFYEMEEKDVAKRFFGRKHHFYWDEVKDMFIVDYTRNCSIVAYLGEEGYGRIIGIGGYFLEGSGAGEVAYSVAKDWQGKGIAVRLQQKVVDAALANGLTGLDALVLKENMSMLALFKKLPYQIRTSYEDGVLTLKCRFDEPA
ncbi:MAG: GNAT family N-acetyltransferase [Syntrophaceae bacterium]|jgi:acyl-CoA hydrolase/RimJ/RimL family protein N-acetyltransferase|nr:GNAT family N-acetyltransferase [Syntrophaceae bacterium]HQM45203.1 GNAT family N-acetyltransferase [Smithellaceae bacterium]